MQNFRTPFIQIYLISGIYLIFSILFRIVWLLAPSIHRWKSRYELQLHRVFSTVEAFSEQIKAKFWFLRKSKTKIWLRSFSLFCENTQKPRTTAENIAYRTNQLPVGAQVFAPTACNPTIVGLHPIGAKTWACSRTLLKLEVRVKSHRRNAKCWIENARKHAKSRTTAENIAYRTNQLPVRAKEF